MVIGSAYPLDERLVMFQTNKCRWMSRCYRNLSSTLVSLIM